MSPGEPAVPHLSPAEVAAAINELSEADKNRLRKVALVYSRHQPIKSEDLLQEAFVRALDGNRRCPREMDAVRFLREAMRSIASGALKAQERRPPKLRLVPATGDDELPLLDPPDPRPSAEEELAAAQEVARLKRAILDLFVDDLEAQTIAEGDMEGMEGEELRSLTGLDEKAFASRRRLVRRRIDKAFPKGWKP